MLDEALNPAAPVDAVVFAPCVELLRASPGNCTAVCGFTEADALIPGAALAEPDPVVTGPPAGAAVTDVDVFDEAAPGEVVPDEPASQPSAVERLAMPDVEQGAPGRLAPKVVVPNAPVAEPVLSVVPAAADGLVLDIVPFGAVV
jgi:hypothetical protein